jgi:hypothetical protein
MREPENYSKSLLGEWKHPFLLVRTKTLATFFAIMVLLLLSTTAISGQKPIERTALITKESRVWSGVFDLMQSVDADSPPNNLRDAFVFINLAGETSWWELKVLVEVEPDDDIEIIMINPDGFSAGRSNRLGTGLSEDLTIREPKPGQWALKIQEVELHGPTAIVRVTVEATVALLPPPPPPPPPPVLPFEGALMILGVAAAAIIAGVVVYAAMFRKEREVQPPPTPPPIIPSERVPGGETAVIPAGTQQYFGALELPGGQILPITGTTKEFGRADFEPYIPKEVASLISRRHFLITFSPRDKTFYIEDVGSTNGTLLNGSEIRGKGKMPLKEGDVISPAGVLNLRFKG